MTTASTVRLETEVAPPVARVKLVHPPLNVIDLSLARSLTTIVSDLDSRPDISVIVFEGDSRAFSAGMPSSKVIHRVRRPRERAEP